MTAYQSICGSNVISKASLSSVAPTRCAVSVRFLDPAGKTDLGLFFGGSLERGFQVNQISQAFKDEKEVEA